MNKKDLINQMVSKFLCWKLPDHFYPDAGINFVPEYNVEYMARQGKPPMRHEPSGTNLFHAGQAEEMFEHCAGDIISELESQLTAEREARQKAESDLETVRFVMAAQQLDGESIVEAIERRRNYIINAKLTAEADRAEYKQRAAAAEARIKASQEQEPVAWMDSTGFISSKQFTGDSFLPIKELYPEPIIPPEVSDK